jgi:transcriptional regulator GlxA family with amidase domain/protocatechuate 3,4-dioxygenase beta subunit
MTWRSYIPSHANQRGCVRSATLLALALVTTSILAANFPQAASPPQKQNVYVCPRCGCAGDSKTFEAPGACPDCHMGLVRQEPVRRPRSVAIVVFDEMNLLDLAGPGEVFSGAMSANGPAFEAFTVAATKDPRESRHSVVTVKPEYTIDTCPKPDVLVIPGGGREAPANDERLREWIKARAADCEMVLAIADGALVLAKAGALDGREATSHRWALNSLRQKYPAIHVNDDRRFVVDGNIVTTSSASAGIDAALHIVGQFHGPEAAENTARQIDYAVRSPEAEKAAAIPAPTTGGGRSARELAAEPLYERALSCARDGQRGALLDAVEAALNAGACSTRTLIEPAFADLHGEPRFRTLIRDHAQWSTNLAIAGEPGQALRVSGVVRDDSGRAVRGALLYVFHADSHGQYTRDKPMDERHARLFGYLRTDAEGRYEFLTIRPGGYAKPYEGHYIPQHIHYEVSADGFSPRRFQLVFDDDPRMADEHWRKCAAEQKNPVARGSRDAEGVQHCTCDSELQP